ncbi:4'-phosphopantetheinyl transferase superfamily protein [Streptomyces sp. 71268]|uniref:4'-phosphopantetheinyl transferase superfamily protein n=1 Tax=Streptomyces sp. 71268 TaxID=3002640 RepID=UPI0023F6A052|nr:4'-phosphopantetheinyl transferase superfamily protein [Streptomyces sp. 71268]WEV25637.1 4'-phosphopantetheinyl transferase superfamily protein [Streptomyces sp. 71268]
MTVDARVAELFGATTGPGSAARAGSGAPARGLGRGLGFGRGRGPGLSRAPRGGAVGHGVGAGAVAGTHAGGAVTVAHATVGELPFTGLPVAVRAALPEYAAPRRRGTYAAGRLAAARATAALTGAPHWPLPGERGAPGWPAGVRGSLTHTDELALCAVTAADGLAIGLDMEPLASADGLYAARRYAATPAELDRARAEARPELAVLRLFCAKEALYKALPAPRQEGLAFRSVTLEWPEPDPSAADGPVLLSVSPTAPAPAALRGATARCRVIGDHMVAAVTLAAPRPAYAPEYAYGYETAARHAAHASYQADASYPAHAERAPGATAP